MPNASLVANIQWSVHVGSRRV